MRRIAAVSFGKQQIPRPAASLSVHPDSWSRDECCDRLAEIQLCLRPFITIRKKTPDGHKCLTHKGQAVIYAGRLRRSAFCGLAGYQSDYLEAVYWRLS